ncbi:peptidoglycan editing factor PgeF [Alkalilimnicola sp. S0819]|uniref:peptidoglycan editing factor PgeF n=1 Tax=Alkalilimnicola sp. S0819 TaxID=2613922 RepID=UPI001261A7CC|nr:peptidoglycan editing factor PgeF [Alkalilimnicola sp. S0819]KAB7623803.1 peptidoglycan editing factor PgeF [Alkalilimnicola sp. S0819]MPQ16677.1 peptidoglycan editing factor PgeF [Alkalilimnicola sp. S0819]
MSSPEPLLPDWPAPAGVRAAVSTRVGGVSHAPYDSLNLGAHVGDEPRAVAENRRRLAQALDLPAPPRWLSQVHGVRVAAAHDAAPDEAADGAWTDRAGVVCAVLTADCLPVLLCDRAGTRVAAAHAGWRGLANGVLEAAVRTLGVPGEELLAWLGPAIAQPRFEVGGEVRDAFLVGQAQADRCFRPSEQGRWLADLYGLARLRLAAVGVRAVYGGGLCTFDDPRFYSYRGEGVTGRFGSLIWLEAG